MRLKNAVYKNNILKVLSKTTLPMDIYNIKVKAGIKNWATCKAILLELLIEGKINGQRSTKGWTFWREDNKRKGKRGKITSTIMLRSKKPLKPHRS